MRDPVRGCEPEPRDPREAYACRLTCSACGDVLVAGELCDLVVGRDGRYAIAFTCPHCAGRDEQRLDAPRVEALVAAGFVARPRRRADAPDPCVEPAPLRTHDVVAFRALLAAHDHLVELASGQGSPGRASTV